MNLITKVPKGTKDIIGDESDKTVWLEALLRDTVRPFGYGEVRTPVFEHTELFERGVGDTTDVVTKEMYTFEDKGGRSITLRPEGTAGAVRAFLESGLYAGTLPVRMYYFANCYRYEKPQAGRWREFEQFGVEMFGSKEPYADAEVISIPYRIFEKLGLLDAITLNINSIGCPECRQHYQKALYEYFSAHKDKLCETCLTRLDKNPMRIIDCKSPVCSEIAKGAPIMLDYLCDECKEHFEKVKKLLTEMGISFEVDPTIVRGLDYYTKTVFEFVSNGIGAQGTVCGGGRYDGLCTQLGGVDMPALGFGMGIGRLLMVLSDYDFGIDNAPAVYIGSIGDDAKAKAAVICDALRANGIFAQCDVMERSVKAQMKYADKVGAKYSVILGEQECADNRAKIKNMSDKTEKEISLSNFVNEFKEIYNG